MANAPSGSINAGLAAPRIRGKSAAIPFFATVGQVYAVL
jgi:hypothetical protein